MKVYYIRVSTLEQNTERQKVNIPEGAKVYEDKCSGAIPFSERENGRIILEQANKNLIDTLFVHSIDRLGRSTLDILNTIQNLTQLGVNVVSQKEGISTIVDGKENPVAKMLISVLATLSEFERNNIKERQKEGIAVARERGVYKSNGGNKKAESVNDFLNKRKSKVIAKYLNEGNSIRRTALLSKSSIGLVQKVSTLIRENGEIQNIVDIDSDASLSTEIFVRNFVREDYTKAILKDVNKANKMFSELDESLKNLVRDEIEGNLSWFESKGVNIKKIILA
jgi:DNA invertase Pin-like site-specific DNA recombinase